MINKENIHFETDKKKGQKMHTQIKTERENLQMTVFVLLLYYYVSMIDNKYLDNNR